MHAQAVTAPDMNTAGVYLLGFCKEQIGQINFRVKSVSSSSAVVLRQLCQTRQEISNTPCWSGQFYPILYINAAHKRKWDALTCACTHIKNMIRHLPPDSSMKGFRSGYSVDKDVFHYYYSSWRISLHVGSLSIKCTTMKTSSPLLACCCEQTAFLTFFFPRNQFSMVDFSKLIRLSLGTDSITTA